MSAATGAQSGQACGWYGRALAACEWCGSAGDLSRDGQSWTVERREEWGGGAYHAPCRDAERLVLEQGGACAD